MGDQMDLATEGGRKEGSRATEEVSDGSMFSTAVSEEQLEEAREKSRRRLFGSSRIFELEEDKKDRLELCGRSIIELRAAEHYGRGVEAVSKADWERAVHFFTKTINLQPQQTRLYVCRAEAYLQLCDFQSAALNYRKASALEPQSEAFHLRLAFIFYLQGQCLFDHGRHLDALESFAKAAELRPDYRPYHMRSLACLAAIGRHSDCLLLVSKRIETEMDDPELYILRARLHKHFNQLTICYHDVKAALALAPDIPEGRSLLMELEGSAEQARRLALSRAVAGNLQEALQKINTALENNPEEVQYYLFRGTLYRRLKDFNTAIDDFILALDRSGGEEGRSVQAEAQRQLLLTYNDFAVHCFTRGFYEEAVMLLNKAIGMEKREKGLYINRGDCFFKQRELEFALADYQQAEELDPLDRSIKIRFAVVYSTMGQRDYESGSKYIEALENFSRAIQYNPGVSQYYEYRAKARQKLNEEHGARQDIIMSLLLDPSNDQAVPLLSRLYPGCTVTDILSSEAGEMAKMKLDVSLQACGLYEDPSSFKRDPHKPPPKHEKPSEEPADAADTENSIAPCIGDTDLYHEIMRSKIKINRAVKCALQERRSLRSDGPRVSALARPASAEPPQDADRPYRWKKFNTAVGLQFR
ncbi:tetratricopeptide repeat protein 16 isoform X1 [Acipenser ruthenus]|uniref:tetratricopeptide repeat protein 16 isoform X1 n=2 Tax=Acipenser ruthenus TaxID=7906 RepID=UPI0027417FE5|nr:tetratricopeptide repeat protein 16 isoform X1 [Acipenser ruthenus]XP_058861623.1 tetratricopeptide repeat protein 16 isoform X1 [Acipenser ruthenus]XP_058861624.1 tetratricopeptide repeat protein 16 isoform X1 [Acipenser ruthenus]